ncbi:MAG: hypothetical protein PHN21_03655 [Erysipelotrichaceae bacterium]|nr:hypothetical protein [Erysipelotrichaceae bacterium]
MKTKILVLTHGDLAQSFVKTVGLITGDINKFIYRNLPEPLDISAYKNDIYSIVKENLANGMGTLLIFDIIGGSPFLISSSLIKDYQDYDVEIISGCNLPMLLELATADEEMTAKQLKELAVFNGIDGIKDLRKIFGETL